ncbi:2-C-methyl-D-erythritol 4-phosphate cytidylyltransferase [Thalassotalea aquiviva]|uniref:2-C-methyl-D-erythritol 4-phosphate cytidylyltransferase n=1 Tax=Thalassotalea aquiviva TaxID=3242415 RepID=UPI00352BB993
MGSDCPKQYLKIANKTILEYTLERLLSHPDVAKVVVSVSSEDQYFNELKIAEHPDVVRVDGGKERSDSVLNGLKTLTDEYWVLVHDAARPCVTHADISALIERCYKTDEGAILATPVRDTMKRTDSHGNIERTEDRNNLWHAQTPQMFKLSELTNALISAESAGVAITDEASALEYMKLPSQVVSAREDNIKVTRPSDLNLATFILQQQQEQ